MMLLDDSGASGPSKFNSVENVRHIKFRLALDWTGFWVVHLCCAADEFLSK